MAPLRATSAGADAGCCCSERGGAVHVLPRKLAGRKSACRGSLRHVQSCEMKAWGASGDASASASLATVAVPGDVTASRCCHDAALCMAAGLMAAALLAAVCVAAALLAAACIAAALIAATCMAAVVPASACMAPVCATTVGMVAGRCLDAQDDAVLALPRRAGERMSACVDALRLSRRAGERTSACIDALWRVQHCRAEAEGLGVAGSAPESAGIMASPAEAAASGWHTAAALNLMCGSVCRLTCSVRCAVAAHPPEQSSSACVPSLSVRARCLAQARPHSAAAECGGPKRLRASHAPASLSASTWGWLAQAPILTLLAAWPAPPWTAT
eukprot:357405-Chlamydomonas_euryale.AAC.5